MIPKHWNDAGTVVIRYDPAEFNAFFASPPDESLHDHPCDFLNFGQQLLRAVSLDDNDFIVQPCGTNQLSFGGFRAALKSGWCSHRGRNNGTGVATMICFRLCRKHQLKVKSARRSPGTTPAIRAACLRACLTWNHLPLFQSATKATHGSSRPRISGTGFRQDFGIP